MRGVPSVVLFIAITIAATGCTNPKVHAVESYRSALKAGDYETARGYMSDDPRRWWGEREGEGSPWRIGQKGRWSDWDEHFNSRSIPVEWIAAADSVTVVVEETNDYYMLTERGPQRVGLVYYLDDGGRISGLLITSDLAGIERSMGRADEFDAWLKANHPEEHAYLRPGGEIDPTGDRPARTRRMLEEWRQAVGLPKLN